MVTARPGKMFAFSQFALSKSKNLQYLPHQTVRCCPFRLAWPLASHPVFGFPSSTPGSWCDANLRWLPALLWQDGSRSTQ